MAQPPVDAPSRPAAEAARRVTLLVHRSHADQLTTDAAPARAALSRMQAVLQQAGLWVMRPPEAVQAQLDALAPEPVPPLALDPGAGAVIVLSVRTTQWQRLDELVLRVTVEARLLVGATIVATLDQGDASHQAIPSQPGAAAVEAALRQAGAGAGEKAARLLGQRLKRLTDEDIHARERPIGTVDSQGRIRLEPRPAAVDAVASAPLRALPRPGRVRALLVAVSDYSSLDMRLAGRMRVKSLPGVKADLLALVTMLKSRGVPESEITVLSDDQATSRSVQAELLRLARTARPDDMVLVSFGAHGAPAQHSLSGYGLPVLADFRLEPDPLALDFFKVQALVGHLPVGQIVLLVDTCHAGGVALHLPRLRVPGGGGAVRIDAGSAGPEPQRLLDALPPAPDRHCLVLASAAPNELSLEQLPSGGLFTQTLVQAVMRAQGRTPLAEIFTTEVKAQVLAQSRPICRSLGDCVEQNATMAVGGRGDLILL